jgi:hypothetical protein
MKPRNGITIAFLFLLFVVASNAVHSQSVEWQQLYLTGVNPPQPQTTSIVATPQGILLAASDSGVFRSSNWGILWERSSAWPEETVADQLVAADNGVVVAATRTGRVVYSHDDGESWSEGAVEQGGPLGRYSIQCLAAGSDGTLYAGGMSGFVGFFSGVFQSRDSGRTWQRIGLEGANVKCLYVSDSGTILAGVDGMADISNPQLYRYNLADSTGEFELVMDAQDFGDKSAPLEFARDSSGAIWLATALGLWKSNNDGERWDSVPAPVADGKHTIAAISVANDGTLLVGARNGTSDDDRFYRSYDSGITWNAESGWPDAQGVVDIYSRNDGRIYVATTERKVYTWPMLVSGVEDVQRAAGTLELNLSSNPVVGQVTVTMRSQNSGNAVLTAFDATGRRVAALYTGRIGAGEQHVSWNTDDLPSGVYLLVLQVDGKQATKAVVVE